MPKTFWSLCLTCNIFTFPFMANFVLNFFNCMTNFLPIPIKLLFNRRESYKTIPLQGKLTRSCSKRPPEPTGLLFLCLGCVWQGLEPPESVFCCECLHWGRWCRSIQHSGNHLAVSTSRCHQIDVLVISRHPCPPPPPAMMGKNKICSCQHWNMFNICPHLAAYGSPPVHT